MHSFKSLISAIFNWSRSLNYKKVNRSQLHMQKVSGADAKLPSRNVSLVTNILST